MKKLTALLLVLVMVFAMVPMASAASTTQIKLDADAPVKQYGRLLPTADGLQVFWPHTAIEFTADFSGDLILNYDSQLAHAGSATGNLRVFLDNATSVYVNLLKGNNQYITLLKNVPAGTHTVRIVNESDLDTSGKYVTWRSLQFTGPVRDMQATPNKELFIEYIGDSITSGKGCLGWTPGQWTMTSTGKKVHMYNSQDIAAGVPTSHSATHSYSYQSAQLLDADWMIVSRGGAGFINDDSSCKKVMELLYDYYNPFATTAHTGSPLVTYTAERIPDVIVLALGTNDSSMSPVATASTNPWGKRVSFTFAAEKMIEKLWDTYNKDVPIILQYGMMSETHKEDFTQIKKDMEEQGGKVYCLDVELNNDGSTSHDPAKEESDESKRSDPLHHPSANGHAINAEILADFINNTVLPEKAASQSLTSLLEGVTSGIVTATKNVYVGRQTTVPAGVTLDMAGHRLTVADYVDVDENGVWQHDTNKARLTVEGAVINAELPSTESILVVNNGSVNGVTVPEGYTKLAYGTDPDFAANSVSLNLNSAIRMNVYATSPFATTKAIVTAEGCEPKTYSGTMEDGELRFETKEFNAKEMGDEAEIKLIGEGKAGVAHMGRTLTTSLKKYADFVIENTNWDVPEQKALGQAMIAMLNYGAEAQTVFGYKTGALVNDTIDSALNSKLDYTGETVPYSNVFAKDDAQNIYYGTSCVLGANLNMKFYLDLRTIGTEGVTATVSYTDYNGHTVSDEEATLDPNETEGFCSVSVDKLVAGDVETPITLTIKQNGATIATVTDSISSYALRVKEKAGYKDVADALMIYGLSAKNYFASKIELGEDELPII